MTNTTQALPDILAPHLAVIFCGINPGATAAATGYHFVSSTNRFWRVLHLAGFTPHQIEPRNGHEILDYGYGLTMAVARPTPQAGDLTSRELQQAGAELEAKIRRYAPRIVAFLGKPAYAAITGNRTPSWGPQAAPFGGATAWLLPNPSGRNRNFATAALVRAYAELKQVLAGVE